MVQDGFGTPYSYFRVDTACGDAGTVRVNMAGVDDWTFGLVARHGGGVYESISV